MTDFWAQYVQRSKSSVDIDNPRVYLENLLRETEDDRKKLETQVKTNDRSHSNRLFISLLLSLIRCCRVVLIEKILQSFVN